MVDVQSAVKHAKIVENSKIQKKKLEKIILELPFGVGFDKFHSTKNPSVITWVFFIILYNIFMFLFVA